MVSIRPSTLTNTGAARIGAAISRVRSVADRKPAKKAANARAATSVSRRLRPRVASTSPASIGRPDAQGEGSVSAAK